MPAQSGPTAARPPAPTRSAETSGLDIVHSSLLHCLADWLCAGWRAQRGHRCVDSSRTTVRPLAASSTARAGSRKVAVPTWTASAPAMQELHRVAAREHSPDADDGRVRERPPGTPTRPGPPPGGSRRRRAPRHRRPAPAGRSSRSRASPSRVLTRVRPTAPPRRAAAGDLDDVGHVRAQLGPAGQPALGGGEHLVRSPWPSGRTCGSGPPRWGSSR